MPAVPHTADIVVKDMGRSLAFYRLLGLDIPAEEDAKGQVEHVTPGHMQLGFVLESLVLKNDPGWPTPTGQRVTLAFRCDSVEEVDTLHAKVVAAGYGSVRAPWDSFWGQRYAFLRDPDGNRVDLFAE